MTTYTLKELHDKRAELAGEIIQLEKRARALRVDLAHVEAAIRILRPGEELPQVVPRRVEYRPRHFRRGALAKLILDYMREHASEAVSVTEMMPLIAEGRTLNATEYQRAAIGVYEALRRAERRKLVERHGDSWRTARWWLADRA
jgi:hypothetical protein